jgi:hypothetical protein
MNPLLIFALVASLIGLVLIIIVLWKIIRYPKEARTVKLANILSPSQVSKLPSARPPFPQSEYRISPSIKEIVADIDSHPPFQQDTIRNSYIGVKMQWYVSFSNMKAHQDSTYFLLLSDKDSLTGVACIVDIMDYPELKRMPSGQKLWVAGKIHHIEPMYIELVDAQLSFENPSSY